MEASQGHCIENRKRFIAGLKNQIEAERCQKLGMICTHMIHRFQFLLGTTVWILSLQAPLNAQNQYGQPQPQLTGQYVCTGTRLIGMIGSLHGHLLSREEAAEHDRVVSTPVKIASAFSYPGAYHVQLEGDPFVYRIVAAQSSDFAASNQPCTAQPTAARAPQAPRLGKDHLSGVIARIDSASQAFGVVTNEGRTVTMTFESNAHISRTASGRNSDISAADIQNGDQVVIAFGSFTDPTGEAFLARSAGLVESPEAAAKARRPRSASEIEASKPLMAALKKRVNPDDSASRIAEAYWATVLTNCERPLAQRKHGESRFSKFYAEKRLSPLGPYETVVEWTIIEFQDNFDYSRISFNESTEAEKRNSGLRWGASQAFWSKVYRFRTMHLVTGVEDNGITPAHGSYKTNWSPWKDSVPNGGANPSTAEAMIQQAFSVGTALLQPSDAGITAGGLTLAMTSDARGFHIADTNWEPMSCETLMADDPFPQYPVELKDVPDFLPFPLALR